MYIYYQILDLNSLRHEVISTTTPLLRYLYLRNTISMSKANRRIEKNVTPGPTLILHIFYPNDFHFS